MLIGCVIIPPKASSFTFHCRRLPEEPLGRLSFKPRRLPNLVLSLSTVKKDKEETGVFHFTWCLCRAGRRAVMLNAPSFKEPEGGAAELNWTAASSVRAGKEYYLFSGMDVASRISLDLLVTHLTRHALTRKSNTKGKHKNRWSMKLYQNVLNWENTSRSTEWKSVIYVDIFLESALCVQMDGNIAFITIIQKLNHWLPPPHPPRT